MCNSEVLESLHPRPCVRVITLVWLRRDPPRHDCRLTPSPAVLSARQLALTRPQHPPVSSSQTQRRTQGQLSIMRCKTTGPLEWGHCTRCEQQVNWSNEGGKKYPPDIFTFETVHGKNMQRRLWLDFKNRAQQLALLSFKLATARSHTPCTILLRCNKDYRYCSCPKSNKMNP